jgi:hypothetical protein
VAWPELARLLLRPEARRPETWRARFVFGLVFIAAGFWSAVAPQVNFSLGERLHLAFRTIFAIAAGLALLAGLRFTPRAGEFASVRIADGCVLFVRAGNGLLPVGPIFLLLLSLQAIEVRELFVALATIIGALAASTMVAALKGPTLLFPISALALIALQRRNFFESSLIILYAAHLYFKAGVAFEISGAMRSPNFTSEIVAPLNSGELCELRQKSSRWRRTGLFTLASLNIAILLLANLWPIKLEEKLPLALVLGFGIVSLFLDTVALTWRGMFNGSPISALTIVLGIPWAMAWIFAALHTGEAFTMNEGAAYFFLWAALGSTLSWVIGGAAKQKALRDFRELAAASPSLYL